MADSFFDTALIFFDINAVLRRLGTDDPDR
jgi:hypothetical protein